VTKGRVAIFLIALSAASQTAGASEKLDQAIEKIAAGQCEDALPALNQGLAEGERDVYFMAGYMFARGVCVAANVPRAVGYLEAAAKAGQSDAAMELVLMHGTGRGVPQSYAEAGRWAVAAAEILQLAVNASKSGGAASAPPSSASGVAPAASRPASVQLLDAEPTSRVGYLATVHALAADEVRLRVNEATQRQKKPWVMVHAMVSWPALKLQVEFIRDSGGPPRAVSSDSVASPRPALDLVESAYRNAMKQAVALPCPASATCRPFAMARQYVIRAH